MAEPQSDTLAGFKNTSGTKTPTEAGMSESSCPLCYSSLDVRDVTPCAICGGWPESVAQFDASVVFTESRLPSGRTLVLCRACELEEFMVPGGRAYPLAPSVKLPIDALQRVRDVERPQIGQDKFCPTCNLRLTFVKLLADVGEPGA